MTSHRTFAFKLTLLIALISGVAVALVCGAFVYLEINRVRRTAVESVTAHARVIAANSTAALDFDDPAAARETLAGLAAVEEFAAAEIARIDGDPFARFERQADLPRATIPAGESHQFSGRWLALQHPIVHENTQLGRLVLLYDFGPARRRLMQDVAVAVAVALLAMLLAYLAARRVQRTLLRPVSELGRAAEQIASTRNYAVRARKLSDDELGRLTDVFNDMIEQIGRNQEALRESEERFRSIADSSPVLMWLNDAHGATFVNRAYLDFLGVASPAEVREMDWAQFVHPDDRAEYVAAYLDCVEKRCHFEAEFRFRRHDGEYRWMRSLAVPRLTAHGEFLGYVGSSVDITEQKRAEMVLRDHQAALEQEVAERTREVTEAQRRLAMSERMASLGTLSAGLGHDIGNILMPLKSHIDLLRRHSHSANVAPNFSAIDQALEYLQNLSSGLRLLARDPERVSDAREATSLTAWWEATLPLLRTVTGNRIELEREWEDDIPAARIQAHLLTQVIFNLVQNAAQALETDVASGSKRGVIRVRARAETGDSASPFLRIDVIDNGPGMSDEVKRRCLEPYFTTKTRRISSGLGLSLVKGIVENAGGVLEVSSEVGMGSTFTMRVPAQTAAPGERALARVTVANSRHRAIITHMLASLDFDVIQEPPADGGRGLWVTDAEANGPRDWRGIIVVLANGASTRAEAPGRVLIDPAAPPDTLRRLFRQLAFEEVV
jgi:PAS domain S-box-containing protein